MLIRDLWKSIKRSWKRHCQVEPMYFDLSNEPYNRQRKELNKHFRKVMDRCRREHNGNNESN